MNIFESDLRPIEYWVMKAGDKLAQWKAGKREGMSTGFRTLDKYIRFVNGELIIFAGRTSMGKTSIAMQCAEGIATYLRDEGINGLVAIFSAEMTGESLINRMASAMCSVDLHKLENNQGTPDEFEAMEHALNNILSLPFWIDDSSAPTTRLMLDRLSEINETIPVKAMLFDFVELGGDEEKNEEQRISSIMRHLKGIAKTLGIPVIAINQLNRKLEERADKMPQMSDVRGSGMAEQVADKIILITRPEYYVDRGIPMPVPIEDQKGIAYVQIAKNRGGPIGLIKLGFEKTLTKFYDLTASDIDRMKRDAFREAEKNPTNSMKPKSWK